MRMYVSDEGNWGIVNEDPFGFAVVNCDDFSEEDFMQLDSASDSNKLITALAIRKQRDEDYGDFDKAYWQEVPELLDQVMKLAKDTNNEQLHELAVKLNEGLGL